jgi:hypothetical protein
MIEELSRWLAAIGVVFALWCAWKVFEPTVKAAIKVAVYRMWGRR